MQRISLYLKPHQEAYLKSICGKPTVLSAKYNLAPFVFSILKWEEYKPDMPETVAYVPDWVLENSGGKKHLSERGNKVLGDYIDSLLDIDFWKYIEPFHIIDNLNVKDGIYLFIDKHNLPNEKDTVYHMLVKRYYRLRKEQQSEKNTAEFFKEISIFK